MKKKIWSTRKEKIHSQINKLIAELENNIENLQKDRDSVFNLDESFYNRLININLNNVGNREPRATSAFGQGYETVDDDKREESKEEDSESSENSQLSREDHSGGVSYSEESSYGIGTRNKRSSLISHANVLVMKNPNNMQ